MSGEQIVVTVIAAGGGSLTGWSARLFLGRLRRGVVVGVGPLEIAAALVAGISVSMAWGRPTLGLVLLAGVLLVLLTPVDVVHHRLPDAITLPALPIASIAVAVTFLCSHHSGSVIRAGITASVLWALFAGTARISSAWMGRGDVKLIPTIGLLTGYLSATAPVVALAAAFVLGAITSLAGIAFGRLKVKSAIPLGPFLLIGCWGVLLAAPLIR